MLVLIWRTVHGSLHLALSEGDFCGFTTSPDSDRGSSLNSQEVSVKAASQHSEVGRRPYPRRRD